MASFTKIPANNKQGYKWVCTLEGPPDPMTGKRRQIPRRGDTKKEALDRAQEVLDSLMAGIDTKKVKNLLFEDVCEEWIKTYSKRKVKRRTIVQRRMQMDILKRYIGKAPITKVTHTGYQKLINSLDDEMYKRSSILGIHDTGKMIFKYAVINNLRTDNPTIGITIPDKVQTVEEIENTVIEEKYLTRLELSDFLKAAIKYGKLQEAEIFYLLAFSGMRSGELCSLKETDLFPETNKVRITKTIDGADMRNYTLITPKTKGSIRIFTIDENIMKMILNLIDKMNELKKEHKKLYADYHDKYFIFRNDDGYPLNPISIWRRMKRILKKTSITKNATPHIFRHTHVSMLAEAGVDLKTIMQRVGHDSEKTTIQIYTHVTDKMKQNADQKINQHFSDILKLEF